jgi:hypothetical protein
MIDNSIQFNSSVICVQRFIKSIVIDSVVECSHVRVAFYILHSQQLLKAHKSYNKKRYFNLIYVIRFVRVVNVDFQLNCSFLDKAIVKFLTSFNNTNIICENFNTLFCMRFDFKQVKLCFSPVHSCTSFLRIDFFSNK